MRSSKPSPTKGPAVPGAAGIQKNLLAWYDRSKRDLPWRRTKDPYAIFVSEMMLQQTQVKTVIPFYGRFLEELPDWPTLAQASEQKVLKLWEGLGYYRRARSLQAAAQQVVRDHGGRLPDTLEAILELPGVGRYSAGAVLSIAYQKPHPVVDGNVIRVLSRIFLLEGDLKAGPGHQKVWDLAEGLLSKDRPGDFNQALMELGATVCLPEDPSCLICPLRSRCKASRGGLQARFPETAASPKTTGIVMAAVLLEKKGKFLVRQRSQDEKWLKGMWEFPSTEGKDYLEALKALSQAVPFTVEGGLLREVRHQITHHKIKLGFFKAAPKVQGALPKGFRWVEAAELSKLPFASAQARLQQWVQASALEKKGVRSRN